jgi:hypothetical protein
MGLFKRCSHTISSAQLEVIGMMYPYSICYYGDLRPKLIWFLITTFPTIDRDTKIIELSEHNGRGRQWGIVLLQRPGEITWELVGQFGHHAWFCTFDYLSLVKRGVVPKNWRGKYRNHGVGARGIRTLKEFFALCDWLDNYPYSMGKIAKAK